MFTLVLIALAVVAAYVIYKQAKSSVDTAVEADVAEVKAEVSSVANTVVVEATSIANTVVSSVK